MSTAFNLIKMKCYMVKSINNVTMGGKKAYCFALKEWQSTVFIKVESDSFQRSLKPLQFNYKPLDVLRCILKSSLNP